MVASLRFAPRVAAPHLGLALDPARYARDAGEEALGRLEDIRDEAEPHHGDEHQHEEGEAREVVAVREAVVHLAHEHVVSEGATQARDAATSEQSYKEGGVDGIKKVLATSEASRKGGVRP